MTRALLAGASFLALLYGLIILFAFSQLAQPQSTLEPCASLTPYEHDIFKTATAQITPLPTNTLRPPTPTATNTPTQTPTLTPTPTLIFYPTYITPPPPTEESWVLFRVQYYRGMNLRSCPSLDCPVVGSLGWGALVEADSVPVEADGYVWRTSWIEGAAVWVAERSLDGRIIFLKD